MNELLKNENTHLAENVKSIQKARAMHKIMSYAEFQSLYPSNEEGYKLIEQLKWGKGYVCEQCKNEKYSLAIGTYSHRCSRCNHIERLYSHTLFAGTKIPIRKALYIVYITANEHSISVENLAKTMDLRVQTCLAFRKKWSCIYSRPKRL